MWSICQNDTRYCALTGDDTSLKKIFELKEKVSCIQLTNRQALKSNNRLFALSSFSCAKGRARLCHVLDCANTIFYEEDTLGLEKELSALKDVKAQIELFKQIRLIRNN